MVFYGRIKSFLAVIDPNSFGRVMVSLLLILHFELNLISKWFKWFHINGSLFTPYQFFSLLWSDRLLSRPFNYNTLIACGTKNRSVSIPEITLTNGSAPHSRITLIGKQMSKDLPEGAEMFQLVKVMIDELWPLIDQLGRIHQVPPC